MIATSISALNPRTVGQSPSILDQKSTPLLRNLARFSIRKGKSSLLGGSIAKSPVKNVYSLSSILIRTYSIKNNQDVENIQCFQAECNLYAGCKRPNLQEKLLGPQVDLAGSRYQSFSLRHALNCYNHGPTGGYFNAVSITSVNTIGSYFK